MNVVLHEHVAVHLDAEELFGLVNNPQKFFPVALVPKYRPPLVATAVTWYQAPGYSTRRGLAMTPAYDELSL